MDDIASILINTALSKNDFKPLLPDDWKTYFSKFIFKNVIQKETKRVGKKKKLDNQNVHDVPFKQIDRQHNIFPANILETRTEIFVCLRHN